LKKVIALFLIAPILFLNLLLVEAEAVSYTHSAPTFYVTDASGAPGEIVAVDVCIKNNSGIVSLKLSVDYDEAVLEPISINERDFAGVSFGALTADSLTLNWVNAIQPNNMTDGIVATLMFRILDKSKLGESLIELSYNPNDVFDSDFDNVDFEIENGTVTIAESEASEEPCFKVIDVSGKRGDTVEVDICILNNSGIVSFKLAVDYDITSLSLISASEKDFSGLSFGNIETAPLVVNWVDTLNPNNKTNGIAVRLTFKISDDCELGKHAVSISYDPNDVYNSGFNNVSFDIVNGEIEVLCDHKNTRLINQKEVSEDALGYTGDIFCDDCGKIIESGTVIYKYILGDADGNGKIEAVDYLILKRIYFGTVDLNSLESPHYALARCDINDNGKVDAVDYFILKRACFGYVDLAQMQADRENNR